MGLTTDQALNRGIEAHREGKFQEAEKFYRAILQSNPKHPDANHNLGVLAVQVGKVHEALPLFKLALESNPNQAQFWLSYTDALIKVDDVGNARLLLEKIRGFGLTGSQVDVLETLIADKENARLPTTNNTHEPSQEQINGLIALFNGGQLHEALIKGQNMR